MCKRCNYKKKGAAGICRLNYRMKYANIVKGCFRSRPNRFVAKVTIHGEEHTVHVKNTGRCRELLTEGAQVYLTKSANPLRKTQFDLVAVEKKRARADH